MAGSGRLERASSKKGEKNGTNPLDVLYINYLDILLGAFQALLAHDPAEEFVPGFALAGLDLGTERVQVVERGGADVDHFPGHRGGIINGRYYYLYRCCIEDLYIPSGMPGCCGGDR